MSCTGGCGPGCCEDGDAPIHVGGGAPRLLDSGRPVSYFAGQATAVHGGGPGPTALDVAISPSAIRAFSHDEVGAIAPGGGLVGGMPMPASGFAPFQPNMPVLPLGKKYQSTFLCNGPCSGSANVYQSIPTRRKARQARGSGKAGEESDAKRAQRLEAAGRAAALSAAGKACWDMAQDACAKQSVSCECLGESGIPKINEKMFTKTEWLNWALAVRDQFFHATPPDDRSGDNWDRIVYEFRRAAEEEGSDQAWSTDVLVINVQLTCGGLCSQE